jgi:hypothetical protein
MPSHSRSRQAAARLGLAVVTFALGVMTPLTPASLVLAQSSGGSTACSPADPGPPDYPVAGGWFYTQQGRACIVGVGPSRRRGYIVQDDTQGAFWTEYRRFGGVDVLGFPVSQRYNYPASNTGGYLYQAFERGILQWHPETGRAELANVFEQFSEQGLDAQLEALGIPRPEASDASASFAAEAERRMAWLSEPRFVARFFFDPVAPHSSDPLRDGQAAFSTHEQAWTYFGLPQGLPSQPYLVSGTGASRVSLYPLVHTFIAQRFQKGGMELFLQGSPNETFTAAPTSGNLANLFDPTIVPGDGINGCVALTATGLLARSLGTDKIIPAAAIQPLPVDPFPPAFVQPFIPPAGQGQLMLQFQLSGSYFAAGEPITILLTDAHATQMGPSLPSLTTHIPAANPDGSWDQVLTARVGTYVMLVTGDRSGKTAGGGLDLTTPSVAANVNVGGATCKDVGVPVGAAPTPALGAGGVPIPPTRTTTVTTTTSTVDGPAGPGPTSADTTTSAAPQTTLVK